MTDAPERWARLAKVIKAQMLAEGLSPTGVATAAEISRETVRPILAGTPGNYRPSTLARVSRALGWTGDSIQRVLDGTDPLALGFTITTEVPAHTDSTDYNSRLARMPDHVLQAVNDIIDAEERRRGLS